MSNALFGSARASTIARTHEPVFHIARTTEDHPLGHPLGQRRPRKITAQSQTPVARCNLLFDPYVDDL